MTVDLRASPTQVTGAFTAAILAWALVAVPVGRWLHRHGGRAVMTCGSLLGTGLLVAWSQVRTVTQLYAVLIGLGGCMAMALYEAATAVIVSWFEPQRRPRALLAMIVVAGFASTIFLPLTGLLVDRYGWRHALLVLAAIHGTITIPLHGLVVRRPPPHHATTRQSTAAAGRGLVVRAALRDSRFWFLAAAFVAHSGAMSAMTLHLVGFLTHAGHPATFAATIAGLLGVETIGARAEQSTMSESESPDTTFNDVDVRFATEMIRHHQQAIEMARIAEQRGNNAQVKQLAARIKAAQDPEIATMSGWLRQWGQPVPSPSESHGGHGAPGGPGMMTDQEMKELMSASGTDFDRMFLQMMIRHHEGAVEMANTEQREGQNPEAKQLAAKIASDQTAEIKEVQELLTKL